MEQSAFYSSSDIENAANALGKLRPAYADILDFYKEVFVRQEESEQHLQLEPVQIPEHVLAVKQKEGFPLIQMSEFRVDTDAADKLLETLCHMAINTNQTLSTAAEGILKAREEGVLNPDVLCQKLLDTDDLFFREIAERIDIDQQALMFFVYNCVKPFLSGCARGLSRYLPPSDAWGESICPVCGNLPGLASIEGRGERWLHCGFCWTKWRIQRVLCVFCQNEDHAKLQYFYSEAESEYRVDTCDQCRHYLKTVDLRKIDRVFYPPLEQVATLHLDMKAGELGYRNEK
ncbi:MAG: formate dehydrogenase accessory protein FdhE [Thermodesulfobacteriota bacterium]